MNKDIAVIGIGMDGDKTLTAEAKEAIESAGSNHLNTLTGRCLFPMTRKR